MRLVIWIRIKSKIQYLSDHFCCCTPQNFIINFKSCIEVNNYGVSVLISLIGSINEKSGKLFFTNVDSHLEKKLKMMGLAAYAEFYSEDKVALESLIEKH